MEIMDTMGGWPVVKGDSWDEKAWSWQNAALNCRKSGYSTDYVVDFSVGTDLKNSSTKIVDVSRASRSEFCMLKAFSLID
jgi:neprilysin